MSRLNSNELFNDRGKSAEGSDVKLKNCDSRTTNILSWIFLIRVSSFLIYKEEGMTDGGF